MSASQIANAAHECPNASLLEKASQGLLTEAEMDRLSHHLNNCPDCVRILDDRIREQVAEDSVFIPSSADRSDTELPTEPQPQSLPPAPGLQKVSFVNRFDIIRKLGMGGMGEVYQCFDRQLHRFVAVKRIRPESLRPELLERLQREVRIQSGLNHPNIVQVHEVHQCEGIPFFTMELVAGQSLRDRLSGRPLAPRLASAIIMQLARAIHFAHTQNVLHRDIKPSNVLLLEDLPTSDTPLSTQEILRLSNRPLAKIADFGLAKILDESVELTRSDMIVGTPAYLSPEQASNSKVAITASSDIYSLGAVLYECLTGHPPFLSHSVNLTLALIQSRIPVSPRQLRPEISRDLETICLKCLEKEPSRRYPSAEALADDLERALHGQPIHARPVNAIQKVARWCVLNKAYAAAIGVAVTSLLVLAAGSLEYARTQAEMRKSAQRESDALREARDADRNAAEVAIAAERLARQEGDMARNNLFASIYGIADINKKLEAYGNRQPTVDEVTDLRKQAKKSIGFMIESYMQRSHNTDEPQGIMINRMFRDGMAIYQFGETEKALTIFEKLRSMARDCPPNHPDFVLRRDAANSAAVVTASILQQQGRVEDAIPVAEEAWNNWPVTPDMPGATDLMLEARFLLARRYADLLRVSGRISEAAAIDAEKERLAQIKDSMKRNPPPPVPVHLNPKRR